MLQDTVVIEGEVSLINQIDGDPDVVIAEGGGIVPSGTIEINENGIYNVRDYASADVDVQGGITPTGTKSITITSNGTTTEDVTNYASASITTNVPASAVDTGTKSISSNGTHDVVGYASASVNVPNSYSASDEGKVVSNGALVAQTSDTVTANDTYDTTLINSLTVNVSGASGYTIADIASLNVTGAVTIDASDIPTVKEYAFRGYKDITSLTIVGSPILENYCFGNCTGITSLTADTLTRIYKDNYNLSTYAFSNCTGLTNICLKSFNNGIGSYTFLNCSGLTIFDAKKITLIQATFGGCSALRTLILRRTDAITALTQGGQNGVGGIYNNPNDSVIYVPQALLSTYQSASNWSALYALNNNIFQKIEGTTYETHWADGTVIA